MICLWLMLVASFGLRSLFQQSRIILCFIFGQDLQLHWIKELFLEIARLLHSILFW